MNSSFFLGSSFTFFPKRRICFPNALLLMHPRQRAELSRLRLLRGPILSARFLDTLHRRGYLVHAERLLLAGGNNLSCCLCGFGNTRGQLLNCFTCLRRLFHTGLNRLGSLLGCHDCSARALLDFGQDCPYLGGRLLGLLSQTPDLLCNDGKTLALIACPCCFNRSVHRQQIRLVSEVVNGGDNFPDQLALLAQSHNALGNRPHLFSDSVHLLKRFTHSLVSDLRDFCRFLSGFGYVRRLFRGE